MVTMLALTEHYKQAFTEQQAKVLVEGALQIEHDLVTREDFSKLTATVDRIAVAQERTEERMDRLAAAQERTEERMDRLAAAQERTEARMDRLATAQERTEERMDQLTTRMDELAVSQRSMQQTFERFMLRTEERAAVDRREMQRTTGRLRRKMDASFADVRREMRESDAETRRHMDESFADVRKQIGGLSLSVGMGLEAYALDRIPRLLEMHCGFKTDSVFPETFTDGAASEEIDVVVRGSLEGRPMVVVCEVKTNITQQEVRDFLARVARVRSRLGGDDVRTLFFGYRAAADTHGMIEEAGAWLALPAGIMRFNRQPL